LLSPFLKTLPMLCKFLIFDLFGQYRMPKYPINEDKDSYSLLTQLSKEGLLKRLKKTDFEEVDEIYKKRLSSELQFK